MLRLVSLAFLVRAVYAFYFHWMAFDSKDYLHIGTTRPPLFAVFYMTLGDWIIPFQCLLGALTVGIVYKIGGKLPALLLTFAPLTLHYTVVPMTETLYTFLVVFSVWKQDGISLGLSALVRSVSQPYSLLLLLQKQTRKMALIALLIPVPWMLYVYSQTGYFTINTLGYAANLWFGSTPVGLYGDDMWQNPDYAGKPNEWFLNGFKERITSDPLGWVKTRVRQYPRLFVDSGDYLLGSYNQKFGENRLVDAFKVLWVLGCIAFFLLAIRGAFYTEWKYVSFPLLLALIHLPMWIETRYFLPAIPFCCLMVASNFRNDDPPCPIGGVDG